MCGKGEAEAAARPHQRGKRQRAGDGHDYARPAKVRVIRIQLPVDSSSCPSIAFPAI
jgi:hypothetical protein